jgi:uncharacterized protein
VHLLTEVQDFLFHNFLSFVCYSAIGWILEATYRSVKQRRFVNAGFLQGPFLPIYGMGATCVLLIAPWLQPLGMLWELLAYGVILTAIEYGIGAASERAFGLQMWDYSDDPFNLHGRVCLHFSILWAGLAVVFVHWIHPVLESVLHRAPSAFLHGLVPVLAVYFVLDFSISLNLLRVFVKRLSMIHLRRIDLSVPEVGKLSLSFQRLLVAYPNLQRHFDTVLEMRSRIDEKRSALQLRFLRFVESRSPREEEFRRFVRDIATHREFLRTKEFRHHDSSIFRHALRVSFLAYRIGKFLDLDARSMARGGLLHDFFLYDWRNHDLPDLAKDKFHGPAHPAIALENASRHFSLNPVERDIIVKHMWPLTLIPPVHLESILICGVDKYVAVREFHLASRSAAVTRPGELAPALAAEP